ncbi:hypothetical protein CEUSTIGMA_g11120.t1 [Chlamydomonas eustigma]|uniref:Lipoyl-binding domain-containing protein n=1 Tax=Chlamydomonas eustigma TaxID=1157962 RepID=A0A250XKR9_9CHLO|nr:hypothetical protein CEUSTIGMA_g11120.t1 [Chlamydomonas eustigma]|eukprot:GAX83695.1 hypothetical protein CEUSTIGMA_g11120.t1 [Chlamydomonas eustigma]
MLCRMKRSAKGLTPAPSIKISHTRTYNIVAKSVSEKEQDVKPAVKGYEHDVPHPVVSTKQVETFLSTIVSKTNIAELELQVGSFELKVKRNLGSVGGGSAVSSQPHPYPAAQPASTATSVTSPALASVDATVLESIDESLMPVMSPKVGIFRRGKYALGKRVGKGNLVSEGDQIKKGQVLGFVEQLGTHFPVEAPQAGEVAKFLVEDGSPVEYQQLVLELAPFFGGHIIGDLKHA